MVTQFFEQWFAPPEGINFGLMAEGVSMNDFPTEDEFTAAYAHCDITREHIGRIYKAIVCPRDDWNSPENIKKRELLAVELQRCPTRGEYTQAIRCAKLNSSGGPTGCTYNMLKALPETTTTMMYNELVRLWENKIIPEF